MTNQTTPPDLIEKVHWAIRKTIVGHADQPMDVALIDGIECDPNDDAMGSVYEAFDRCAQAAIAALADHQPAPVAPSGETPDEFIAEALRLGEPLERRHLDVAEIRKTQDWWPQVLAHAATLHKQAVAREALKQCATAYNSYEAHVVAKQALAQIQ